MITNKLQKTTVMTLLLGSLLYLLSFYFIDQPIAYALQHVSPSSLWYLFSQQVTLVGDSTTGLLFTLLCFVLALWKLRKNPQGRLANHLLLMALAMIIGIFLETSLKFLLGRYRPELLFQQGLYGFHFLSHQFLLNSTPSGHATRCFIMITGLSLYWRRLTPVFVAIGLLVCLSRLVLEFHYLSDVLFGAALGIMTTLWVSRIYNSITLSSSYHF